jgi:uncharacterized membrane protein YfcA
MDLMNAVAGLAVGFVVGLTGVGGGSLMAPLLILLFGVAPATAVGTDLWFAAITKSVGGLVHHRTGKPDLAVVRLLCLGSLPATAVTLWFLTATGSSQIKSGVMIHALGIALLLSAVATLFRGRFVAASKSIERETAVRYHRWQPILTVVAGAILGVLVTLTSVGAGALGATMLLVLYPMRLTPRKLVGTDIIHAVPLTFLAGLGHLWMGNVNPTLLVNLLAGSIPGIVGGSLLASRVSNTLIQQALALVLAVTAFRLLS